MTPVATILLMAGVTYLLRLAGFLLSGRRVAPFWLRSLRFVPISVFGALTIPALPGQSGEAPIRFAAAALTALVLWRFSSPWLGILVGMGAFWSLRLAL